ncbi:phytanoyl-CoA dioxygenase [Kitasatospora sp. NPDC053057]|uniref:phytanoyl-CoA dioxygenase n=1 Tax=Kitasatospora sp. NPDC053057 TaxID=3364062 RepID=UPI0037C646F2
MDGADRATVLPDTEPFAVAAASPKLGAAHDRLIGEGRWTRRPTVGGEVPVRFPSEDWPGTGYHVEGNWWGGEDYWTDVRSRGRGLTAFFLFSDVGPEDAPTRLLVGSHLFVPPVLARAGEAGMSGCAVVEALRPSVLHRQVVHVTGRAGDVYLCHPFMVHTATWPHRGVTPRMMAQPGVEVVDGFAVDGSDPSPVAQAIVEGLEAHRRSKQ